MQTKANAQRPHDYWLWEAEVKRREHSYIADKG
jgi:hypothetical protein